MKFQIFKIISNDFIYINQNMSRLSFKIIFFIMLTTLFLMMILLIHYKHKSNVNKNI